MRTTRIAALLTALALLASACGSSTDDNDDTSATTAGEAEESASDAEVEGDDTADADGDVDDEDSADASDTASLDALIAAAEEEGSVTFYTSMGVDFAERLIEGFEAEYPGIDAEYIRGNSNEMITRIDTERSQGVTGADVAVVTAGQWYDGIAAEGELVPIAELPEAPNWENVDERFVTDGYFAVQVMPFVVSWNTDIVTEPIEGYEALLREDLAGQVGSLDLVSPTILAFYQYLDEQYGPDFVQQLGGTGLRLYQSTQPGSQALSAGEVSAMAFLTLGNLVEQSELGAPVAWSVPDPAIGSPMWAGGLGWSENPNASRLLLNYIMSPDGQAITSGGGRGISALGSDVVPDSIDSDIVLLDPNAFDQAKIDELTSLYEPLIRN